ncbi:MAG TPA: phosphate ABC transporter ATP-binding protein [Firmicutes bacterium]|nr:phosphate ABC transporter ATP-binding protein [Candidatus Fermentithermobacillaceae bacterium]
MEKPSSQVKAKVVARDFRLYYGDFMALKGLNAAFPDRSITAIIGPSGCGKSTFLRSINRMNDLIKGTRVEGEILYEGKNVYDPSVDLTWLRSRIGMVFQRPVAFPLSIYDNVACAPRVQGITKKSELDEIVEWSLRSVGLWDEVKDDLKKSALGLSLGNQQKLCIARAISTNPEVILLDEPASALDPIATLKLEDLMWTLREKYCLVIVTHNMQQAARASDYTVFMLGGEIVEVGPTRQVFTNPKDPRTERYITGKLG